MKHRVSLYLLLSGANIQKSSEFLSSFTSLYFFFSIRLFLTIKNNGEGIGNKTEAVSSVSPWCQDLVLIF